MFPTRCEHAQKKNTVAGLFSIESTSDLMPNFELRLMCTNLVECKSVAVRLHLWSADSTHGSNCDVLLHRAPPLDEDGTANTVQDFLNLAMPPLLKDGQLAEGVEILLQGLQVPLDTPLYWLSLHASYLDHFVHLVARMPDTSFGDTVNQ